MAQPPTPWTAAMDDLMADGHWRTLDELVDAVGPLIPPGVAHRRGELAQARARTTGTGPVQTSDDQRDRRGRREILRSAVNDRVRRHVWTRSHDLGVSTYRAVP